VHSARGGERRAASLPPGLQYMLLGAFFFSVMSLLVKLAGQRLPSQEIVLGRSVVMAVLAWAALRARRIRMLGQRPSLLVLRGVLGFCALSCFYYALVHLPLADATVLQYTNAAFAGIFAVAALGERMRRREVAALTLSMAGVLLVARPAFLFGTAGLDPVGSAVGLAGAIFSGAAYVVVRMLGAENHLVVILYFAVVSILLSLPAAALQSVMPTPLEVLLLVGVGVTTHAGQVNITRGLRLERAGRASAVGLVQIVFAAVWGVLFFATLPDGWGLAGAALVIGGVLVMSRG
jgi:drug/metabolite transporter (DMT)-like permease